MKANVKRMATDMNIEITPNAANKCIKGKLTGPKSVKGAMCPR